MKEALLALLLGWYSWPALVIERRSFEPKPPDETKPSTPGDAFHRGKDKWTEAFDGDPQYWSKLFCCMFDVMLVLIVVT